MRILSAAAVAAALIALPAAAGAQERVGDAALGALAGAVVAGPVGAIAGGAIGYTAGPRIARRMGVHHRRHIRHARRQRQAAQQ
jgi:outer membrane lipoprotein SlyB